ncbi:MAG: TerC family protein, partial [Bacteroidota bacterium]|nr:TerC family protein [Bacteroidota bacterium]
LTLIEKFHFAIYFLGAFLIIGGLKMLFQKDLEIDPGKSFIIKVARKFLPVLKSYHEDKFFIIRNSVIYATPLFIVLIVVETTDIIFALDSIPAIIAISTDPFIVYSSNIFAILGLRSLFFALSGIMVIFHHLKYGLSIILIFVGVKLLVMDIYKIDIVYSLLFIGLVLISSIVASILFPKKINLEPTKKAEAV